MPRSSFFGGDPRDDNQEIPSMLRFTVALEDASVANPLRGYIIFLDR